ncbi:MAG: hypothetical protein JNN05_10165 [Candidatus Omnitrophica bacterium]|nr:hypothetical protein [Candidatus Omnitrophota bacterium]
MKYSYNWIVLILSFSLSGCHGSNSTMQETSANTNSVNEVLPSVKVTINETNLPTPVTEKLIEFKPFAVYKDKGSFNKFAPSGYMPTGECLYMNDAWTESCAQGKTCIKVIYDIDCSKKSRNWAGIYWLNPADNWGDRRGGYNLTGAQKLTFWARGEKGGERIEEFKIGGVGRAMEYPDSDSAFIGPVILTKEWKEYTIDLRGKELSYISGGFAWVSNTDANAESCVFYLDEIEYK